VNKSGEVVYIGQSSYDVIKIMLRHFQSWDDKTQKRAVYNANNHKVKVIRTNTAKKSLRLEEALIEKFKPRDNELKLDLYRSTKAEKAKIEKVLNDDDLPF